MFFLNKVFKFYNNITIKKIQKFKNLKKKNLKKISISFNKTDSWRKKIYFKNLFSKSYFNWKFNSKFTIYLLKNNKINFFYNNINYNNLILKQDLIFHIDKNYSNVLNNYYYFLLFYKNFFFFFPINIFEFRGLTVLFFDKYNSNLEIHNSPLFWLNISLIVIIKKWFNNILKTSFNYIFIKLKYKGKNYRWHRKKKGIVLRFGHSHLIYSKKPTSVFLKKKGRMKIIFFGTNVELIYFYLKNLIKWKPSNVYTGRGLRLSRFKLLKKAGKISAYR